MASVATVTGGPITKEEDDKGEEGLLFLLEVAGFEQVASSLAFWGTDGCFWRTLSCLLCQVEMSESRKEAQQLSRFVP